MSKWALYLLVGIVLATIVCQFAFADEAAMEKDESAASSGDADADAGADSGDAAPAGESEPEIPLLLVHKEVSDMDTVPGKAVTVTVTVINVGNAPAYNVVMTDKAPFVDEQTEKVAELQPGANISRKYDVTPQSVGHTSLPQAEATYTATEAADGAKLRATSNEVREEVRDEKMTNVEVGERGFINVVTQDEYDRMKSTHIKEYIIYAVFCVLTVAYPYMQGRQKTRQIGVLLREARKK